MTEPSGLYGILADLTEALCAVPSVTGQEAALADLVQARLLEEAPHLRVDRVGNALAAAEPPTGRPLLLLVGHLDTVPPAPGYTGPRREGDRLHALGASDMKAGLAILLHLARSLADVPAADRACDLGLAFYDREEGPFDENGLEPLLQAVPWLRRAALALCLEPTDGAVEAGCVGSLNARVTFTGRAAHAARPWLGENAIHKAGPFLCRLLAEGIGEVVVDGLAFRETWSATLASGGRARNVVPDRFEVNVNHRFAPGVSLAEAEGRVLARVAGEAEVTFVDRAPAGPVVRDNALLDRLLARGIPRRPKQAWTDVARLAMYGIPAVNFGPGSPAQAHQADEHVELTRVEGVFREIRGIL